MTNDILKKWLLSFGADFNIKDIYHVWRPDDKLRVPKDYFTFEVVSSEPTDRHQLTDDTSSGHNVAYTFTKRWKTVVSVKCFSENGHYILQCLEASRHMSAIQNIFGDTIKSQGCSNITSEPWIDESSKEYCFKTEFTFIEWVTFTKTETGVLVETLTLDGDLLDANSVPVELTATATKTIPT
jgi:hypothetical protein